MGEKEEIEANIVQEPRGTFPAPAYYPWSRISLESSLREDSKTTEKILPILPVARGLVQDDEITGCRQQGAIACSFTAGIQSNLAPTAGKDTTLDGPVTPKRPPPPRGAGLQRGDLSFFWAGVEATLALSKGVGGHQGINGCISFTLNTRGKCEGLRSVPVPRDGPDTGVLPPPLGEAGVLGPQSPLGPSLSQQHMYMTHMYSTSLQ